MASDSRTAYRDKLRSLTFGPRQSTHKVTVEGDATEGSRTAEYDDHTDVQVFIPPVEVVMDMPMWRDTQTEVADTRADAARQPKTAASNSQDNL